MKLIKDWAVRLFRLFYFIPVLTIVIFLTVLFGHKILGPGLPGSDNSNFITLARWLSDWFPRIPFWYPQQGGGMSFTISYPILNHLIVVLFEKITSFPIAVSFRIWSLISIVLTSIGIFFMSFKLTKNQTVASLAAIFYPLCPISWIFLLGWGFSAEQLSYWLIPPVFLFLPILLDEFYLKGFTKKFKIYFLLFAIFLTSISVGHSILFVGVLMFVGVLLFIYPPLVYKEKKFKKIFGFSFFVITVIFLLSSFWIIPFFRYQSIAAKGAPVEKGKTNYELFMQTSVYAPNVFHLTDKTVDYTSLDNKLVPLSPTTFRNVSFPFVISLLALIGLIGSFFINKKVFTFGLAMVPSTIIAVFPQMTFYLMKFPFADYFLNWRGAIAPARFIIPLLAGFGCYSIAYLLTFPLKRLLKPAFILISSILTIAVSVFFLWQFKNWPQGPDFLISYGVDGNVPSAKLDLRNVWRKEPDKCFGGSSFDDVLPAEVEVCKNYTLQKYFLSEKLKVPCSLKPDEEICKPNVSETEVLKAVERCDRKETDFVSFCEARAKSFWQQVNPKVMLSFLKEKDLFSKGVDIFGEDKEIFNLFPNDANLRLDIGTSLGIFMMVEPFYNSTPELPVYYNQGTLIKNFWNYEISIMNMKDSIWPQDNIMKEIGKYFGLKYILLSRDLVPLDKYERTGWNKVGNWGVNKWSGLELWKNSDNVSILSASTKPTVLVIGQDKVDGYFRIFHLANLGAIPFDEAIVVKGGPYVDAYNEKYLSTFDLVILEGYSYKSSNRRKGWDILNKYVENGGSLLVNTGWQYSSADWKVDKTPVFFPLTKLDWVKTGKNNDFKIEDSKIIGDIDTAKISPLIYENKEWNVSSSDKSYLRDWASVILSSNNIPLIAGGNLGRGKVIWMGMDLPGHIAAYEDNNEEVKLYTNLVSYLLGGKESKKVDVSFRRNYPDKLEIFINESTNSKTVIYLSEAFYPDFKARLIEKGKTTRINSYKAGPGMTAFILPKVSSGSKIIYKYKPSVVVVLSKLISVVTLISIILTIIKPGIFSELKNKLPKIKWNLKNDEEDY